MRANGKIAQRSPSGNILAYAIRFLDEGRIERVHSRPKKSILIFLP